MRCSRVSVAWRREGEDMKQGGVHAATPASVRGDVWKVVEDRAEHAVWEVLDQYPESVMSDAQYANIIKHVAGHLATVLTREDRYGFLVHLRVRPEPHVLR